MPEQYYLNLPDVSEGVTLVCDPMLGDGRLVVARGAAGEGSGGDGSEVHLPAGLTREACAKFSGDHPDVPIFSGLAG